jgi:hypothetical protein
MDREKLGKLSADGLTIKMIALAEKTSQTNVRYWLRKYGLRTRRGPHGQLCFDSPGKSVCACGETDPTKFYGRKKSVCGVCHNRDVARRASKIRMFALQFLGGECVICGFNKYSCSLDIHHVDPMEKMAGFRHFRYWSLSRAKAEILKCVLLCKNCHAAFHDGEIKDDLTKFLRE